MTQLFRLITVSVAILVSTASPTVAYGASDGVRVQKMVNVMAPYRERRDNIGILFSIQHERYFPEEFVSVVLNKTYNDILGSETIPLFGAELGLKYNFSLGSVAGLISYSTGSTKNVDKGLNKLGVSITKASLNYSMDNLFNEPWLVPYIQGGAAQTTWNEQSETTGTVGEEDILIPMSMYYRAGIMIQLNGLESSIDETTHANGLRSSGLENTFIDVYYTSYNSIKEVEGEPAVDLSSNQFGVGLKLEF